jgi:hypothetical protein
MPEIESGTETDDHSLAKLWRGQYPLGKAFWGYFVFGGIGIYGAARQKPILFPDTPSVEIIVFQLLLWAYTINAAVGVWRSADALIDIHSWNGLPRYSATVKIFSAKLWVLVWICALLVDSGQKLSAVGALDWASPVARALGMID